MNKKAGYAFPIVLGGYLAYIGIRMLIQMANERPSNMVFMSVMAVIFVAVGSGYAIYSLKKVWDLRKEEMTGTDAAAEEELADTSVRPIDIKKPEEKTERKLDEKSEENAEKKTEEKLPENVTVKQEEEPEEIENDYEEK